MISRASSMRRFVFIMKPFFERVDLQLPAKCLFDSSKLHSAASATSHYAERHEIQFLDSRVCYPSFDLDGTLSNPRPLSATVQTAKWLDFEKLTSGRF